MSAGLVARAGRLPERTRRLMRGGVIAVLVLALLAAGVSGWRWYADLRAGARVWAVVDIAKARTEQLLSYDAKALDADLARGRAQVTGDYAARYERTATELIGPDTRDRGIVTIATVARAALVAAGPDGVQTLLYVNQATTSTAQPTPRPITSQVRVTLSRVGEQWLISGLDPV